MVNWYEKLTVQIKWCKQLSVKISVYIRTRQGGISSPLLFNRFYQELVDALSKCPGGKVLTMIHLMYFATLTI